VKLIFEELESIVSGTAAAAKIQADIESSNAVFVVVTPKLASLAHSRDWVAWETGVAAHRDVWVLELRDDSGQVEVITPALKHAVRFDASDAWFPYFRAIITELYWVRWTPSLGTLGSEVSHGGTTKVYARV
jgi:hypothetical protein